MPVFTTESLNQYKGRPWVPISTIPAKNDEKAKEKQGKNTNFVPEKSVSLWGDGSSESPIVTGFLETSNFMSALYTIQKADINIIK